jgi:predicted nucleotidyltransferase
MITLTDLLIEREKLQKIYFDNYLIYAKKIKKEIEKILGKTRVFVFGSILQKSEIPQDIDILVISPKIKKIKSKGKIIAKIWEKIGFDNPFEIHLITPKEYQDWYKFFIKEKIEIK